MQIKIDTEDLLKRSHLLTDDAVALFKELAELDASPVIETIAPELRGAMLALEDTAKALKKAQEFLIRFNAKLTTPIEVKTIRLDPLAEIHLDMGSSGDVREPVGALINGSK